MELRHLRYFVAVAESGSLTVAAGERLHTSQPSLSRQIRDLEYQVGAQLLSRSTRGVELTPAGRAFLDHARVALAQVDAAAEAARRAAHPLKQVFALGFLTGQEMTWLPRAMGILRDELPNIDVTVSSDYSSELADALVRGKLDLAFLRAEPQYDLAYRVVSREPLVVLMPSEHPLAAREAVGPEDFAGEVFVAASSKETVLGAVADAYLKRAGIDMAASPGVDSLAAAISLVAAKKGFSLMPASAQSLLPWSVVSRPLAAEAPTIDLVVGYSEANLSPVLRLFLSRVEELEG
jgi:LysR family hca operon transcriptional activator